MFIRIISTAKLMVCFSLLFLLLLIFFISRNQQNYVPRTIPSPVFEENSTPKNKANNRPQNNRSQNNQSQNNQSQSSGKRLGEPPSVILAPNASFCDNYRYLVIVITRIDEPQARRRFEATYGRFSKRHNFTYLFPVGLSTKEKINIALRKEHEMYSHILQTNFIDSYRNLTLKSYSYANYLRENCTRVRAVLKTDDDIVWNVRETFKYLDGIDPDGNILYCKIVPFPGVERRKGERWYVPYEEYPHELFPPYCLSPIYAATPATFARLSNATRVVNHVWLDDVFSVGIVAKEAGVTFEDMPINYDIYIFEPFFNGSALAAYPRRPKDALKVFMAMNLDEAKVLGVEDLV